MLGVCIKWPSSPDEDIGYPGPDAMFSNTAVDGPYRAMKVDFSIDAPETRAFFRRPSERVYGPDVSDDHHDEAFHNSISGLWDWNGTERVIQIGTFGTLDSLDTNTFMRHRDVPRLLRQKASSHYLSSVLRTRGNNTVFSVSTNLPIHVMVHHPQQFMLMLAEMPRTPSSRFEESAPAISVIQIASC
jgi:hypothetical protein